MADLVSVIIPVYNTEKYIGECIKSVLEQTYQDLQVIIVDDGSTDGCSEIADSFAEKDSRVNVIHQKNMGPSAARNAALDIVEGKYVYCIDSDDVMSVRSIEVMVEICNQTGAEICISGYQRFADSFIQSDTNSFKAEILDPKEATKRMTCDQGFTHSSCGKLYLTSLWEGIRFPMGKIYEDYQTTFKLIAKSKTVAFCPAQFYCYRIRSGSIMRTPIQDINIELLDISAVVTDELIQLYPDMKDIILYQKARTYLRLMKNILSAGFNVYPDAQKRIIKYIKSEKSNLLSSGVLKFADKIKVRTICISRTLFYAAYKVGNIKNKNLQD